MNLTVVLLGSRATIACIGFRALRELGIRVPLVIAGDEDPGVDDWRLSLASAARQVGYRDGQDLFVVHDPHVGDVSSRIRAIAPDVILSLQWRRIIRPSLIQLAKRGVVNLHNAPLPLLRGCDPFSWAIHDGLEMMGVTLHQIIDEGIDSGPILAQRLWNVTSSSTAWSLHLEGLREGERLLRETLPDIVSGGMAARPQEARYSSYHPMGQFQFKDLEVQWGFPATTLSAALRSRIFPPFQLPFFYFRGRKVEIVGCESAHGRSKPGTLISVDPMIIATKPGAIQLHLLKDAGVEQTGTDFARSNGLRTGDSVAATRV